VGALVPLRLRDRRQQRLRIRILEREPRVAAAIEARGDTRREATEASVAVVEDD
jgi:hypothetical protein